MSGPSLEEERQNILHRMQVRREGYRRMLTDGSDIRSIADVEPLVPGAAKAHLGHEAQSKGGPQTSWPTERHAVSTYRPVPVRYPRSALMRVLMEHPLLCAAGVAAVVAIGPKRILRTVMTGGTAASTLVASNQSNIDLLGRILTMAGAYVQGRTNDKGR